MDKFIIDLVQFCNDIDNYNKKTEKITIPNEPYNTYQIIKNDLTLSFNQQAKLLFNININTPKQQPYSSLTTMDYRNMSIYQLSYYLYWRTITRNGKLLFVDFQYLKLYIYEQLAVSTNPNITIEQIKSFYDRYPYKKEQLKVFLQLVLTDFYLVYEDRIKCSYEEIQKMFDFKFHCSNENTNFSKGIFDQDLTFFNSHSSYKVINSKFYNTPVGKKTLTEVMPYVWSAIYNYFKDNDTTLTEFVYGKFVTTPYTIFRELPNITFNIPEKSVSVSYFENYIYVNGRWNKCRRRNYSITSNFFAFILKYTEMKLREYSQYKHKITANTELLTKDCFLNEKHVLILRDKKFLETLDSAIKKYIQTFFKKKDLTFNISSIEKIQQITSENEEKLKVEEYEENRKEEISKEKTQLEENNFLKNLSNDELFVVNALLKNINITEYLIERNIMPEVIFEEINEKALEFFGDNIIDTIDKPYIYEEYFEELGEKQ